MMSSIFAWQGPTDEKPEGDDEGDRLEEDAVIASGIRAAANHDGGRIRFGRERLRPSGENFLGHRCLSDLDGATAAAGAITS